MYDFDTPVNSDITLVAQFTEVPPYDPANPTLDGLQAAMAAGDCSAFPPGTKIPDTYDGQPNGLIVAQYLDSSNNSAYGGAEGAILIREFVAPESQAWDKNDRLNYSASTVHSYLQNTYPSSCTADLNNLVAEIDLPYSYDSGVTTLKAKYFLMSVTELIGKGAATEGIALEYWRQKTGLSSPNNSNNTGRAASTPSGTSRLYWTRSSDLILDVYYVGNDGAIASTSGIPHSTFGLLVACFIPKPTS